METAIIYAIVAGCITWGLAAEVQSYRHRKKVERNYREYKEKVKNSHQK